MPVLGDSDEWIEALASDWGFGFSHEVDDGEVAQRTDGVAQRTDGVEENENERGRRRQEEGDGRVASARRTRRRWPWIDRRRMGMDRALELGRALQFRKGDGGDLEFSLAAIVPPPSLSTGSLLFFVVAFSHFNAKTLNFTLQFPILYY